MKTTIAPLLIALTLAACDDSTPACAPAPSTPTEVASAPPAIATPSAKPVAPVVDATPTHVSDGPKVVFADEPERAAPDVDRAAELRVKRLVLARGVKDREPVESSSTFAPSDARIYAFVEVQNPDRASSEITISFQREGERERGPIHLRVGPSPRWRTWAFTRLATEPGTWEVIVRDGDGDEIGRERFSVEAPPTAPKTEPLI